MEGRVEAVLVLGVIDKTIVQYDLGKWSLLIILCVVIFIYVFGCACDVTWLWIADPMFLF